MKNTVTLNPTAHNNFISEHRNTIVNTINKEFAQKANDELMWVGIEALLVGEGKRTGKKLFTWNRNEVRTLGDKVADICEEYISHNIGQATDIHPLVCHTFRGEMQLVFDRTIKDKNSINLWKDKLNYETI